MEKGEPIVVVKEVGKNYGTVEALKEVSFVVERGEIFGLIGPDGAGKSSLFRILTTLLLADKGTAMVAGLDVVTDYKQIRTKVGYMPGRFSLYQDLSVEENLEFFATVFHTTVQENYVVAVLPSMVFIFLAMKTPFRPPADFVCHAFKTA